MKIRIKIITMVLLVSIMIAHPEQAHCPLRVRYATNEIIIEVRWSE